MEKHVNLVGNFIISNKTEELKDYLNLNNINLNDIFFTLTFVEETPSYFQNIFIYKINNLDQTISCEKMLLPTITWNTLFLALFFGCDKEMMIFIIENSKDLNYKDENGSTAEIITNLSENKHEELSRIFRKYVDLYSIKDCLLIKEFKSNMFHFNDKYLIDYQLLDSDFTFIQKNDCDFSSVLKLFVKDEYSFYFCNLGSNLYYYSLKSKKLGQIKDLNSQFLTIYNGFYYTHQIDELRIFNPNRRDFLTIDGTWNSIKPFQNFLFLFKVSKDDVILKKYQNFEFKNLITQKMKFKLSTFSWEKNNNHIIIQDCYLITSFSNGIIHIYYFSLDSLEFIEEIECEKNTGILEKIDDDLIISVNKMDLIFWNVITEKNKHKISLTKLYKITVPTTLWKNIWKIEYDYLKQTLIVVDQNSYSFIYKISNFKSMKKLSYHTLDVFFYYD